MTALLLQLEAELRSEQLQIADLIHLSAIFTSQQQQSDPERIQTLKEKIRNLEKENENKKKQLAANKSQNENNNNDFNLSTKNVDQAQEIVHQTISFTLPNQLVHEHALLSQFIFHTEYQQQLTSEVILKQEVYPLIFNLSQEINQYFDGENNSLVQKEEEERKRIEREDVVATSSSNENSEEQDRVSIVHAWHRECSKLLEASRKRLTELNSRGSELQHTLGKKSNEFDQAREELEETKQNVLMVNSPVKRQIAAKSSSMKDDEDDEIEAQQKQLELLKSLQDQFSELQHQIHSRPTHSESGLDRFREQIFVLSQELTQNRTLLAEMMLRDEEGEIEEEVDERNSKNSSSQQRHRKKTISGMQQDLQHAKRLKVMKKELDERITQVRQNMSDQQNTLNELKIEEQRQFLAEKQNDLTKEIDQLRDRLLLDDDDEVEF